MNLEKAIKIAVKAHSGQVEKNGDPGILHPLRVMHSVSTNEEKIVAVLHDAIEDSKLTFKDLKKAGFSDKIVNAVKSVSNLKGEEYFKFIKRASKNKIGRIVKIADTYDKLTLERFTNLSSRNFNKYKNALDILKK